MNFYTHAVLAAKLSDLIQPADPAAYQWGAVVPDIRYPAGMRRQATHLPDEEIAAWRFRYPGCESFIQGYRVHCLLDRIDTLQVVAGAFPLSLLGWLARKKFSARQMTVVVELYYHRAQPAGLRLVGAHNPILEALGIGAGQSAAFASALSVYLAGPSLETGFACFSTLGMITDTRIERYIHSYQSLARQQWLLWALMKSVQNARLERLAADMARSLPGLIAAE